MTLTNLLLVDDEKPFVETMVKRLTKRNLSVNVAFNGQEAEQAWA
jgi:ActR/RegA family two-component response regulator